MWRTVVALSIALLTSQTAVAQQASYGQYLLVLDDSGSMDQNDARRLVVMAALSFAAALEDGDQVMIAGLNELAEGRVTGPSFVSPRELLAGRDGPEGLRRLEGGRVRELCQHEGGTPCRDALARVQSILNAVASSGAPQTVLMLTDGACNGGAVDAPDRWLSSIRAHEENRFRFVLLMREGRERLDQNLARYGLETGWSGETRVSFDARALLRAFADVLSFSRGLRYDDGGRIGLERTFAGARTVRVLSIHDQGSDRIAFERVGSDGGAPIAGGPTYRHPEHQWSLRVATDAPAPTPYAVRSSTAGADVMVIPVYGRLRIEAIVGPCGEAPALPWNTEQAVRAGQPACAWARLVGDEGTTIHPTSSFAYAMDVCTTEACQEATAMQPGTDGTFNAQLGAEFRVGRHQRVFRASGGALATPVTDTRGFSAMSFGVHRVAFADTPQRTLSEVDVGVLPKPVSDDLTLTVEGSFPAGARASIRCTVDGDAAIQQCVRCAPETGSLELQNPFQLQVSVRGTSFCQAVSDQARGEPDGIGELPVRMSLELTPEGTTPPHRIPLRATLRYAAAPELELSLQGGSRVESTLEVPGPLAPTSVAVAVELDSDELTASGEAQRLLAGENLRAAVSLEASADDCCSPDHYPSTLVLTPDNGDPPLRLDLAIEVQDPGFWTCPGKQIAFWTAIAAGVLFLIWVTRGFVSPAKFREGAVLMWASSHDALLGLRDGDDGWRHLKRFPETKRRFRRAAALHLGGPMAPLPSLKRMPADAYLEAQAGGGVRLIVRGPGIEKFQESTGWTEIEPGQYPVSNRITLRRGDEIYLQFRR
ncbi:MAG: vWA domain-containing protein [Myxococcota bacterium]